MEVGTVYDVVVVGTRAAGAATAMLLARAGLSVLAVDRAHFPSDTLSTHQVQTPGIACLHRWGLLDAVAATTPAVRRVRLDAGSRTLMADYPAHDGVDAMYGPRRTLLDALLVDAARAAGAEVVEGFTVTALTRADDGRVTGIRGHARRAAARTVPVAVGAPTDAAVAVGASDGVTAGVATGVSGGDLLGVGVSGGLPAGVPGGGVPGGVPGGVRPRTGGGGGEGEGPRDRAGGGRGKEVTISGRLVVGADGKHSFVARQVGAAEYRVRPAMTFGAYSYWEGMDLPTGGEIHIRPGLTVPAFATNDGLTMVAMFGPLTQFDRFRSDPEAAYLAALDRCGDLGVRVREAKRVERIRATPDATNAFRVPYGPGWALVGDAGLVEDPVGAQGISNAFRDAQLLADAVVDGNDLSTFHEQRDAQRLPMYGVIGDLARLRVGLRTKLLLRALSSRPDQADRFLGVLAGSLPPRPFLDPANVLRILAGR